MRYLLFISIFVNLILVGSSFKLKSNGPEPLCDYDTAKPKQLHCQIEQGSYIPSNKFYSTIPEPFENLIVVEYNVDRNGLGGDGPNEKGIQFIVEAIQSLGHIDVLILSEVARDCPEYGYVSGAQVLAMELGMAYAYSVEYLSTDSNLIADGYECTIGNAILSNRPLTKVMEKRFFSQCCQFGGRAGGRVVVKANIPSYNLTVLSSHLESGTGFSDFIEAAVVRELQSKEMVALITKQEKANNLILIGGDFNSPLRQFDKGEAFASYLDPMMGKYPWPHRNTCVGDLMSTFGLGSFDYVYFKNSEDFEIETEICKTEQCYGYSDHFPLRFEISRNQQE